MNNDRQLIEIPEFQYNDFWSRQYIKNKPPIEFLCKRFGLKKGESNLMVAAGNSGKSFLAGYMSVAVAMAKPVFDLYPVAQGKVLHLDLEMSKEGTDDRLDMIAFGLDPYGEFDFTNLIKRVVLGYKIDDPRFATDKMYKRLVSLFCEFDFVVIDSLKKISGADENSSAIECAVDMIHRTAIESDSCVMMIHHKGKEAISSNGASKMVQSARGHSSIFDSVDNQLSQSLNRETGEMMLACDKARHRKRFNNCRYEMISTGQEITARDSYEGVRFLEKCKKDERLDSVMGHLTLLGKEATQGELLKVISGKNTAKIAYLDSLVNSQTISMRKEGSSYLYSLPNMKEF